MTTDLFRLSLFFSKTNNVTILGEYSFKLDIFMLARSLFNEHGKVILNQFTFFFVFHNLVRKTVTILHTNFPGMRLIDVTTFLDRNCLSFTKEKVF